MDEDINAANGITVVFELAKWINSGHYNQDVKDAFDRVLSLWSGLCRRSLDADEALIAERQEARAKKILPFGDELAGTWIKLLDTKEGVRCDHVIDVNLINGLPFAWGRCGSFHVYTQTPDFFKGQTKPTSFTRLPPAGVSARLSRWFACWSKKNSDGKELEIYKRGRTNSHTKAKNGCQHRMSTGLRLMGYLHMTGELCLGRADWLASSK